MELRNILSLSRRPDKPAVEKPRSFHTASFRSLKARVAASALTVAGCGAGAEWQDLSWDGGFPRPPAAADAGRTQPDASTTPAADGGSGSADAGTPVDAGTPAADAGTPTDAGTPIVDAGSPSDAGAVDAGTPPRPDRDGDFIPDDQDPCPDDRDNRCRTIIDNDLDGVDDNRDNCPPLGTDAASISAAHNPNQADVDEDGYGDICDCEALKPTVHPGAARKMCNGVAEDCSDVGLLSSESLDGTAVFEGEPDCACRPGKVAPISNNTVGECKTGLKRCEVVRDSSGNVVGSAFSVVQMPVGPTTELCNGLNDDCDEQTDEGTDSQGRPICECPTVGETKPCGHTLGQCAPGGVQVCGGDNKWTSCIGESHPAPESCNRRDDDCDSATDNSPEGTKPGDICNGNEGACKTASGKVECASNGEFLCSVDPGGSEGPAVGAPETLCDNRDENCKNGIDEGQWPYIHDLSTTKRVREICTLAGSCGAGVTRCVTSGPLAGQVVECSSIGNKAAMDCRDPLNDKDCSGPPDATEMGVGGSCTKANSCGASETGVKVCNTTGTGTDCKLQSETLGNIGSLCAVPVAGDFAGTVACRTDASGQRLPYCLPTGTEQCNGRDDNGDRQVDEGFGVGTACTKPNACGTPVAGVTACNTMGTAECSVPAPANGLTTVGQSCALDNGRVPGEAACRVVDALANQQLYCKSRISEVCGDSVDNDGDGIHDNGFDVGAACKKPNPCGKLVDGIKQCTAAGLATECVIPPPPFIEVAMRPGVCLDRLWTRGEGKPACDIFGNQFCARDPNAIEILNDGWDNDGDGLTDELPGSTDGGTPDGGGN